jgi:hypothetical protein
MTGTLTLSFTPASTVTNWNSSYTNAQFASGCANATTANSTPNPCTATFTIASSQSAGSAPLMVGTVAGTITVTVTQLSVDGVSVLPSPAPSSSVTVAPAAPSITVGSVAIVATSGGFTVQLDAYSNSRDLQSATFNFSGSGLTGTTSFNVPVSTQAATYFESTDTVALQNGGSFQLTVPFTYSGDINALQSVTVTLTNSMGVSSSATGDVQQ